VRSQTRKPRNKQTHWQNLQKDWTKTEMGSNKGLRQ